MMEFFSPKPPVSQDEFDWLFACIAWLHRTLGEDEGGFTPSLARPDTDEIAKASTARELFDAVRTIAGLREWHCRLEAGDPLRDDFAQDQIGEYAGSHALGTFSIEGNEPVIRYDPGLVRNPDALVSTFAHELAHLVNTPLGDPPGGHDLHEHATDCTAVYLGFGVFLANSARQFDQFQDGLMHGWRAQTSGYLSEQALVTVTAIWVRLFDHDPDDAEEAFKPYLKKDFRKALKYVDRSIPDVPSVVATIDLSDWQ